MKIEKQLSIVNFQLSIRMILELLFSTLYIAHNSDTITNQSHNIDEVVVVSTSNIQGGKRSVKGKTASIDELVELGKDIEKRTLSAALKLWLEHRVFVYAGRTFIL